MDIKLEEDVTGRQFHSLDFAGIPSGYNQSAAVGVSTNAGNHVVDLIDGPPVRSSPVAPLGAIHAPEVAFGIGPLIPNAHSGRLERTHIGFAPKEPKQLVKDRLQVQLFRRQQGEALLQIEPRLGAKERHGSGAGSVGFRSPLVENELEKVEVCAHGKGISAIYRIEKRNTIVCL